MSNQLIVIIVNVLYSLILISVVKRKHSKFKEEIFKEENDVEYLKSFYVTYSFTFISFFLFPIALSMFWNSEIFNYKFPISFIFQFIFQLIILILYFLKNGKIIRFTIFQTVMIFGIIIFFSNGLIKKQPEKKKSIEMTVVELKNISEEINAFKSNLLDKIKKVNKNIDLAISDIEEKEKKLSIIDSILQSKSKKLNDLENIISLNEQEVESIFNYIDDYNKKTTFEELYPYIITFVFGIITSIIGNYFYSYIKYKKRHPSTNI